jgi:hypothetical protein
MTQQNDDGQATQRLRADIRNAFPAVVHAGPITPADGKSGEDYDETELLYEALHGKAWPEIPARFVRANSMALVMLTEEAFGVYLPAWLNEGLTDQEVGEAVVYMFCNEPGEDSSYMDRRLQHLNHQQKEVLQAFLTHRGQTTSSQAHRESARRASAYVEKFLEE